MSVLAINSENYSTTVDQSGTVIVKVSSPTCGPCKMMAGLFDKLASEITDVTFTAFEVVTDEDKTLAVKLGVSSVPAFLIYKDNELQTMFVGAYPLSVLKTKLGL